MSLEDTDRLIAELKLANRIKKEQANKTQEDEKNKKEKITLEDTIKSIKEKNEVMIGDKFFRFDNKSFLNGVLNIPIVRSFFEEKRNDDVSVSLINRLKGITFNAAYYKEGAIDKTFAEFKEGLKQGFTMSKLYMEWLEEGTIDANNQVIYYGTYKVSTGPGDMYNLIFYKKHNNSLLLGNFNCFYKDIEEWELIIKASTMLMKVK